MKLWILIGALDGKIDNAKIFLQEKEALTALQKMRTDYDWPNITRNDVVLWIREI